MTDKLTMLKPEIREGYLDNGERSEKYRALHVPDYLSRNVLVDDISAGATPFKPCYKYLDGKKSHMVIIECDSEEQGLLAASYIRGAMGFYDPEECDDYIKREWLAYDNNLPIVGMDEIAEYESDYQQSSGGEFVFRGMHKQDRTDPYWTEYCGDICIVDSCMVDSSGNVALKNHNDLAFGNPFSADNTRWHSFFGRFFRYADATVYYILVSDKGLDGIFEEEKECRENDADYGLYPGPDLDQDFSLCKLILEYTAEVVDLRGGMQQKERYYTRVFRNWAQSFGFRPEKNFPVKEVLKHICRMDASPSRTIEKILRYVKHKYPERVVLTKELFYRTGILKKVFEKAEGESSSDVVTMDDLVGMEDVKKKFADIILTMKFSRERKQKGLPPLEYRNVYLLIGAPGTAKTTMAGILGRMMKKENLLKGTRIGSFSGAQLKGEFVGQTAHRVHEIFEMHDILIIDEAYSLTASNNGHMDSYSQEALAQLAIELENHGMDKLVFFAGYGGRDVSGPNNKMKEFLDSNPGIKSRINGTIVFPSYDLDQMLRIVEGIAGRYSYEFESGALELAGEYFAERIKDESFGNGREARSFVDNCQMTLASRIMHLPAAKKTRKVMQLITREDVKETVKRLADANTSQHGRRVSYGFI